MKKIIRLLPVVLALMMIFAFGALATEEEIPEIPGGETEVIPPEETEIVLPEAPTNISCETYWLQEEGYVEVIWTEAQGADGYDLYIKEKDEWVYKQSAQDDLTLIYGLLLNSKYELGIRSYIEVDGVKYHSEDIATYTIKTPSTMYDLRISKGESVSGGLNITWESCHGISGYRLYVRNGSKWVKVKDIYGKDNNSYTYTDVVDGKSYTFAVKGFVKGTEGLKFGVLGGPYKFTYEDVKRVKNINSTVTADSITLNWEKIQGAKGYRIYLYQGGKWKALKTTTSRSYTVTGLEASKKYIFRVRAYEKVNGATVWFPYSKNYSAITGSKTVDAYRVKNLQKSFSDGDWHIKIKAAVDDYGNNLTLTFAGKGENLFMRYDYGKGLVIEYLYLASKDRLYIISDSDKEYVIVPKDEAEYFVEMMYAMAEVYKVQNVGKVTAKTCVYNGYSAVVETYTDTKYGIKKSYYFVKNKLAGVEFTYDGEREAYSSFTVTDTPSSSLFKVPSGYKKVNWDDVM